MKAGDFRITSPGDLEVVLLYETHLLLGNVISTDYYDLRGSPPFEVSFRNDAVFGDFLVHVEELFALGSNHVQLGGRERQLSLFAASEWFSKQHPVEADGAGLSSACKQLREWLDTDRTLDFWCGALRRDIQLDLSRRRMIYFAANLHKHGLFRLGRLMEIVRTLGERSGLRFSNADLIAVRDPLIEELNGRLEYLASWLVEMLGAYFLALNSVIVGRYNRNPTNDVRMMRMPPGVTSDAIRDLYGSTLVFHRYSRERIASCIPVVPELLKRRY
jgi:hypothetical protein